MAVDTYNLKEVIISVNGIPATGFGDNDALTVEYQEDAWMTKTGADGEVVRSRSNNEVAFFRLTLMQTSEFNQVLQAAVLLDKQFGRTLFGVSVVDLNRSEVLSGADCYIQQSPQRQFNKEAGEREWTIVVPRLVEGPLSGLDFGFPF
jgi:hypothetical protein